MISPENPWKFFYVGWVRNGRFSLRELWSQAEEMDQHKFVPPAVVQDVLRFPPSCEPGYKHDTPEKRKMMAKLVPSVQQRLSDSNDPDSPFAPDQQLEVWVSKFDPGDPYAVLVVQGLPNIFQVSLQSPEPKEEETYQQSNEYFVSLSTTLGTFGPDTRRVHRRWKRERRDKLRTYGVKETVVVALDGSTMRGFRPSWRVCPLGLCNPVL